MRDFVLQLKNKLNYINNNKYLKPMKIISLLLLVSVSFVYTVQAQTEEELSTSIGKLTKMKAVKIQTTAQCDMCKLRIEEALAFRKGVKNAQLNLEDKVVTVIYNPKKTNPDRIREVIAKVGYQADEVKADPKAYEKLPECCQLGGHDHEKSKHED